MDPDPTQTSPAAQPAPIATWPTRLIGAGIVLSCLLLLTALLSYDVNEMGWGFLNSHTPEAAAKAPCTNLLGVLGLYVAGLVYYLLGAAAPYSAILCSIVGGGMLLNPASKRTSQWISFGLMVFSACGFLASQNFAGLEWAQDLSLKGVGGGLGYLFGTCIVEALIGPAYSAILFILIHAGALIYFARQTPRTVAQGIGRDIAKLRTKWQERRERKRLEREQQAQEWKRAGENDANQPGSEPAMGGTPAGAPAAQTPAGGQPQQMPLPIGESPVSTFNRQPDWQGQPRQQGGAPTPAPQAPVPRRQRPPLVIPPRPADHPDPFAPRPVVQEPTQPADSDRTAGAGDSAERAAHVEQESRPEPVRTPEPERRPEPARKVPALHVNQLPPSHGDNLLDLMEGIEEDIERSSYSGSNVRSTAIPRNDLQLNPRLRAAANRHMGISEPEPEPARPAAPKPEPRPATPASTGNRYEPAPKPAAPAPTPEPEDEYNGMYTDYPFPPYDLLNYTPPSPEVARAAEEEAYQVQQCLIDTFSNFNITVEPGDITRGPSLTRYEFYPPKGLRLSRIANLGSDLMLATQTKSVNILAPIPGKNTVGIELENATKESVYLRELLESPAFHNPKLKIPVALGKNVYGEPVIGDLAAMPHALVAGTTGSGKSVCINSMILSMLYKFRPDELRLVLVDPKVVEMQPYRKLPHLACPVVTNPARVIGALRWAVNEMEHRYSMFSKIGVRNFEDFNNRPEGYMPEPEDEPEGTPDELPINSAAIEAMMSDIERSAGEEIPEEDEVQGELDFDADEEIPAKLPYIVIIIDELADLMMVVKEDLENYIARLTQKARAAGIHLVAATQTPRSNVVTGLIKANIPCRIALKVASPLDSRIILDTNGAENLLGKGDLLFLPPGGITKLTRAQGAWVSDAEIASIIKFCASHAKQKFVQGVTAEMNNADGSGPGGPGSDGENGRLSGSGGGGNEDDELYTRCVNLVVTERKASTSLLQRRFSIGYGRAAKIMDMMEARGVISSPQGATRAREVLVEAPE